MRQSHSQSECYAGLYQVMLMESHERGLTGIAIQSIIIFFILDCNRYLCLAGEMK